MDGAAVQVHRRKVGKWRWRRPLRKDDQIVKITSDRERERVGNGIIKLDHVALDVGAAYPSLADARTGIGIRRIVGGGVVGDVIVILQLIIPGVRLQKFVAVSKVQG